MDLAGPGAEVSSSANPNVRHLPQEPARSRRPAGGGGGAGVTWRGRESVRIGLYAAAVSLPVLAVPWLFEGVQFAMPAMPPAAGLTAGLCWWWLGARRSRVGPVRAAGIGALAGVLFHFVLWGGVILFALVGMQLIEPVEQAMPTPLGEWLITGASAWLVFSFMSLLLGGLPSVAAGVLGALLYVRYIRPRWRGVPTAEGGEAPGGGAAAPS